VKGVTAAALKMNANKFCSGSLAQSLTVSVTKASELTVR
jgi:hypothetical protein